MPIAFTPNVTTKWQEKFRGLDPQDNFRTIKLGLSGGFFATYNSNTLNYNVPNPFVGLVNLSSSVNSEDTVLYADNVAHYIASDATSEELTLSVRQISKTFMTTALGGSFAPNKMFSYSGNKKAVAFGVVKDVKSTDGAAPDFELTIWYNVVFKEPTESAETTTDTVPDTPIEIVGTATKSNVLYQGRPLIKSVILYSDNPALFDSYMEQVITPNTVAPAAPTFTITTPTITTYTTADAGDKFFSDLVSDAGITVKDDDGITDITSSVKFAIDGTEYALSDEIPNLDLIGSQVVELGVQGENTVAFSSVTITVSA